MAEELPRLEDYLTGIGLPSLALRIERALQPATLRYFERHGGFARAVEATAGLALPQSQQCARAADGLLLAWRSPTETLCLAREGAQLARLAARLADSSEGCLIDLKGALRVVGVRGARVAELLCRLGSTASVPAPGEARRSRVADVPVLAVRAGEDDETLLIVDRLLAPHLLAWIRETVADFEGD